MIDESMDKEAMNRPPEPWEFRSKPAWQRLIVMIGGVTMNIIAGIVIFAMIKFAYGDDNLQNKSVKYGIIPNELASELGFRKGDKLKAVNGTHINYFQDAINSEIILGDAPVYTVERSGKDTTIHLPKDFLNKLSRKSKSLFFTPRMQVYVKRVGINTNADKGGLKADDKIIGVAGYPVHTYDEFQPLLRSQAGKQTSLMVLRDGDSTELTVLVDKDSTIGFNPYDKEWIFDKTRYTFLSSFPAGVEQAYQNIADQVAGWGKIFKGDIAVNKALSGPIGIAQVFGGEWDWLNFWMITALISLGLAFMNILPIPALDGGHVVLLLIEMITGRPLSDKWMERIQMVGMVILLSLMVLIFGNDIWNLIVR
jgi:regulator of sigma E protease